MIMGSSTSFTCQPGCADCALGPCPKCGARRQYNVDSEIVHAALGNVECDPNGMERTYIVCVKVNYHDADLLDEIVPRAIRARFEGTAIRVIECEPQ
jgi:hypothetical protein